MYGIKSKPKSASFQEPFRNFRGCLLDIGFSVQLIFFLYEVLMKGLFPIRCFSTDQVDVARLFVRLSSLSTVFLEVALGRELLGLGPRSSWFNILRGGVVHLVFMDIGFCARNVNIILRFVHVFGKDASRMFVVDFTRMHDEPAFRDGFALQVHV